MKFNSKKFSVSTAIKKINNLTLDLAPEYQRGPVWSKSRQALLIDSMLKGYDLPKFYVRLIESDRETYEVVDGLQRLTSMVNFQNGDFQLPKTSDWAGMRYKELPDKISETFDDYQLDFTILENFEDEDVRDMFLRLQNGLKLNAAEELNAVSGHMHDFVEEISEHAFFKTKTSFTQSRGANRHVAAQLALLAIDGYGDIRKKDLIAFYKSHAQLEIDSKGKQLKTVLTWLTKAFEDKDPALRNRGQVVSIVMAAFDLWGEFVLEGSETIFQEAIHSFDEKVISGEAAYKDYANAISHSSDQYKSVETRREILLSALVAYTRSLSAKDSRRMFGLPERVLAWYRSGGKCQMDGCDAELTFQDFHADHIRAWSKGGQTNLENLQVLCPNHNLRKGAR